MSFSQGWWIWIFPNSLKEFAKAGIRGETDCPETVSSLGWRSGSHLKSKHFLPFWAENSCCLGTFLSPHPQSVQHPLALACPLGSVQWSWFNLVLPAPPDRHLSQTGFLDVDLALPAHLWSHALQPSGQASPSPALSWPLPWSPAYPAGTPDRLTWRPSHYTLSGAIPEKVLGTHLNPDSDLKEKTQTLAKPSLYHHHHRTQKGLDGPWS